MKSFLRWLWVVWVIAGSFHLAPGQADDDQHIERLVLRQSENQAEIWRLHADGELTRIAALDGIVFGSLPGAAWQVPVPADTAPSADGQQVAFTAQNSDRDTALFLVSLNPLGVRRFDAPGAASVQWSPARDALLLSRPSVYLGGETNSLEDGRIYVFDLATEAFTLIAQTSDEITVRGAVWSADDDYIVVSADPQRNAGERRLAELYVVGQDGTGWRALTNLLAQAPEALHFDQPAERNLCDIAHLKWSGDRARLYYVLACHIWSEVPLVSLFSVDLEGNNRLEIDLYESFPETFAPAPAAGHDLIGMFINTEAAYLVVNSPRFDLQVIRVSAPGQAEIAATITGREGRFVAMSESGTKIAISMDGNSIALVDLPARTADVFNLPDSEYLPCRVQWVGESIVLIDEVIRCENLSMPVQSTIGWMPDTRTTREIIRNNPGEFSRILPQP